MRVSDSSPCRHRFPDIHRTTSITERPTTKKFATTCAPAVTLGPVLSHIVAHEDAPLAVATVQWHTPHAPVPLRLNRHERCTQLTTSYARTTAGASRLLTPEELGQFYAGSPELFRRLYYKYTPELIEAARRLTETREDAQDVVQETWLRVYGRRHTFTGEGSLRGWIHAVARAVGIDYYRSLKRRTRRHTLFEVMQAAEPAEEPATLPPVDVALPEDVVRYKWQTRGELIDAIMRLTPRQRDVVVLRFLAGRTTPNVAKALGITESTVRTLIHQAVQSLRRRIWQFEALELGVDDEES